MIAICTGETSSGIRLDALRSIRDCVVATMDEDWYLSAEKLDLPRMYWNELEPMLRFATQGTRKAIMLAANDNLVAVNDIVVVFQENGIDVWKVIHLNEEE